MKLSNGFPVIAAGNWSSPEPDVGWTGGITDVTFFTCRGKPLGPWMKVFARDIADAELFLAEARMEALS